MSRPIIAIKRLGTVGLLAAGLACLSLACAHAATAPVPALGAETFGSDEIGDAVGSLGTGTSRNAFFYGGYLYANYAIWDMSSPRSPRRVADQSNWASLNSPHIFSWSEQVLTSDHRLHDMSDILRPRELAELHDFGGPILFKNIQWPYLYRASAYGDGSFRIDDISDPTTPRDVTGSFRPNDVLGFRTGAVHALGNLLVISSGDNARGMSTWDISDPLQPRLVDSTGQQGPGMYFSFLHGNHVYSAGPVSNDTIGVWRIEDDFSLTYLGQQDPPGMGDYIWFWEGYGFGQEPGRGGGNRWGKLPLATIFDRPTLAASGTTRAGNRRYAIPMGNLVLIAGNNDGSNLHYVTPHQGAPDRNGPRRLWTVPVDGAVGQAVGSRIGVAMNEPIDSRSIDDTTLVVRPQGGAPISGRLSANSQGIVNFTPDAPLRDDTTYEVVVVAGGMADISGNGAVESITRFSTGPVVGPSGSPVAAIAAEPTAGDAPLAVVFDGGASSDPDGSVVAWSWDFGDGESASGRNASHVYQRPGDYEARLTVTDDAGRISSAIQRIAVADPDRYEAEEATLAGPAIAADNPGFTGSGYADYGTASGETIGFAIAVPASGSYRLDLRYANGDTVDRPLALAIDGVDLGPALAFAPTGGWDAWSLENAVVDLAAGSHRVVLRSVGPTGPNLDHLHVTATDAPPPTPTITILRPGDGAALAAPLELAVDVRDWAMAAGGRGWTWLVDGAPGAVVHSEDPVTLDLAPGDHVIATRLVAEDGSLLNGGDSVAVSVTAPADGAFVAADGLLVVEAEHAQHLGSGSGAGAGSAWSVIDDALASGGRAQEAGPDAGVNLGDTLDGPVLGFDVRFPSAGTWYAWVRGFGPGGGSDSVHLGLDGVAATFGGFGLDVTPHGEWTWADSVGGARVVIDVPSAGAHRLQLWMREDGVRVDKLVLSADPAFVPSGSGPAESARLDPDAPGEPPVVLAGPAGEPSLVGASASFTALAEDPEGRDAVSYQWSFGDGSPRSAPSPDPAIDHVFTAPGHYTVILRASDRDGTTVASFVHTVHHPLLATPTASSGPIQLAGDRVVTVNPDNDSLSAIAADGLELLWEVAVGDEPQACAVVGDRVWIACAGGGVEARALADGALVASVAMPTGSRPHGIVAAEGGRALWVALEQTGELARIDLASGGVTDRVAVGTWPRGLATTGDGRLVVTRFVSPQDRGEVVLVDLVTRGVIGTVALAIDTSPDTEASGRGVPNYLAAVAVAPDGRRAWIAAKKDNVERGVFRENLDLGFENTVRAIAAPIDLATGSDLADERIDFNDSDRPSAIAFSPRGDLLFAALQGNDRVEIRDPFNRGSLLASIPVGAAPQGLALDAGRGRLFVKDFLGRSVTVVDVSGALAARAWDGIVEATVATVGSEVLAPAVLRGKRLFYHAGDPRMSRDGYQSCASCHDAGGSDARVWDFTGRGEGLRNTIDLLGRRGTGHGRVHWSANFDEIHDFEHDIRGPFAGSGLMDDADFAATGSPLGAPKAGLSAALDDLAAYVTSLDAIGTSPHRPAPGTLTPAAAAGRAVFARLDCQSCHAGDDFTDSASGVLHDVGTLRASSGGRLGGDLPGIDTPTLLGLWRSAPYLHDGSAASLDGVFDQAPAGSPHAAVTSLGDDERSQLLAYLRQIDDAEPGVPPRADDAAGSWQISFQPTASPLPAGWSRDDGAAFADARGHGWLGGANGTTRDREVDPDQLRDTLIHLQKSGDRAWELALEPGVYRVELLAGDPVYTDQTNHLLVEGVRVADPDGQDHFDHVELEVAVDDGRLTLAPAADAANAKLCWIRVERVVAGLSVNFQPATSAVPDGDLVDSGAIYGPRGGGRVYGWLGGDNPDTRERNLSADQRADTLTHLQKAAARRWEIALPDGSWAVSLRCGDPAYTDQVNHLLVEGVRLDDPDGEDHEDRYEVVVEVTDGRLTIEPAPDAVNAKLAWIGIEAVPTAVASRPAPDHPQVLVGRR